MQDVARSKVILGTMNFVRVGDSAMIQRILAEGYDRGITAINTADTDYSGRSESSVGAFIESLRRSGRPRPWIMLEISGADMGVPHNPNLHATYLTSAIERSLTRLGIDCVDRVVLPRPSFTIPLEETLAGIEQNILGRGLASSYGLSTFPAWLTCHAQHLAAVNHLTPPASELAPFNVLDRRVENEILPNARFWGMEFFAWAGLAQGLLAGRYPSTGEFPVDSRASVLGGIYSQRVNTRARRLSSDYVRLAHEFSLDPAAAALAWVLARPGVTGVLAGPRLVEHTSSLADAQTLVLPPEFLARVDLINAPGSAVADFFNSAPWMLERISASWESE